MVLNLMCICIGKNGLTQLSECKLVASFIIYRAALVRATKKAKDDHDHEAKGSFVVLFTELLLGLLK